MGRDEKEWFGVRLRINKRDLNIKTTFVPKYTG